MPKKLSFLLVILVVIAGYFGGMTYGVIQQASAKEDNSNRAIRAQAFQLVDKKGNLRGGLGFDENGHPTIGLRNINGNFTSFITARPDGSMFVLRDQKGRMKIGLNVNQNGEPFIVLKDKKDISRLIISCSERAAGVGVWDSKGKERIGLFVDDGTAPKIGVNDSQGNLRVALGVRKDEPIIALTNQTGKAGIVMSVNKKDVPNIQLSNSQNVPQLVMAVRDNNEPGVWLFDRGKIVRAGLSYADETGPRLGMRFLGRKPGLEMGLDRKLGPHLAMISESGDYLSYLGIPAGSAPNMGFFQGAQPLWSPAQSGASLPGAELPLTDDLIKELTR